MKAAYSTPALHVKDIARSIHFYSLLGFELGNRDLTAWHVGRAIDLRRPTSLKTLKIGRGDRI